MFNKKKCGKCRKSISGNYDFCPYCGSSLNENFKEDWGMLGKTDSNEKADSFSDPFFGGINSGIMGKMINSAMKMLENEMKKTANTQDNPSRAKFKLMINGKEVPLNSPNKKENQKKPNKKLTKPLPVFSENKRKEFQKLKREEPKSNLKRFSDKVIYEIEIPGLKKVENVSILKLENSVEIKAIGNKKSYEKILSLNSPLINYSISKNNLILEFEAN